MTQKYGKNFDINQYRTDEDEYDDDGFDNKENLYQGSALDDYTGWDNDLYNPDGTLRQGSLFDYDYENQSKKTGAASSWWRSKVRTPSYSHGYYHPNGGGSHYSDEETALRGKLQQELLEIARTVNAVRNTSGSLNREKNLKVAWSVGSGYGKNGANNIKNSSTIFLSPDPLTEKTKIKPDWTEDQRRDALIGEALTLTSMKKTLQPVNVKKIMEFKETEEEIKDLPLMERSEQEKFKLRVIARELWKSLETYKAQAEMLREYRGSRTYFSAYLAFYSDKNFKEVLQERMDTFKQEGSKYAPSIVTARALAWNINHANISSDQVEPTTEELEDAMIEAFDILMEAVDLRSTFQRWEVAVQAAEILNELDPEGEEEGGDDKWQKISDSLDNDSTDKIGNSDNLFGEGVSNDSQVHGNVDCNDLEDNRNDSEGKGLTDYSQGTEFITINRNSYQNNLQRSRNYYTPENKEEDWDDASETLNLERRALLRCYRYLKEMVEPWGEMMILPEYGLRSGRLSGNALWKVPTQLMDNDRVFHRNQIQGEVQNVSIALMMDFSGSMAGGSMQAQRRVGVLLHDLFKDFPLVDFHMFGHESWHTNQVYHFQEPELLYMYGPNGGTNEGTALARVAHEFLQLSPKKNRKVILSMGDGCSSPQDIKNAVRAIKREKMEVYDILIDGQIEQASDCYGKGKVVTIASKYNFKDRSSLDFGMLGIDEHTEDMSLLEKQLITAIRPWLSNILSRMHFLGSY
jgi:hypothetical protein